MVAHLRPLFEALAPGIAAAQRTPGRSEKFGDAVGTAEQGLLHCGGHGAGHFVKMVHNGIEYGVMAAYAEGLNILRHANIGQNNGAAAQRRMPVMPRPRPCATRSSTVTT